MSDDPHDRDGFVVKTFDGEEIAFIACTYSDRMRERVLAGLLRNMREDCFAADTRDKESSDA